MKKVLCIAFITVVLAFTSSPSRADYEYSYQPNYCPICPFPGTLFTFSVPYLITTDITIPGAGLYNVFTNPAATILDVTITGPTTLVPTLAVDYDTNGDGLLDLSAVFTFFGQPLTQVGSYIGEYGTYEVWLDISGSSGPAVPEPATSLLVGLGLIGLGGLRRILQK